jgi:glutathione S-transferase
MLEIWGRISSLNVRKVVWAAQELGLPFERRDAGGRFGVVDTPEYRRLNPNALVPLLVDEDFVLWESNAIVRYLGAKHAPGSFYPQDLRQRFDAERWMDWQQTELNPAGRAAFTQLIRVREAERDAAAIAESVARTEPLLSLVDEHLSRQPYMAGQHFTMADVPLACEIHRWFGLPRQRPPRANIERWYAAILARPTTRGVLDLALE